MLSETLSASVFEMVQISTQTMLSYQARLCEPVALNCTALHYDSITWRRLPEAREITNSSDGRIIVLSDQLIIHETNPSDNGTYTCTASNRVDYTYIIADLHIGMYSVG